jgi:ABC-type uncharacterized transport system substrate-binding protein
VRATACAFVAMLGISAAAPAHAQVLAVLGDASAGYQAIADELEAGLAATVGKPRVERVLASKLGETTSDALARYELVVTVGLSAAQAALAREAGGAHARVLCVLIPRLSFEKLAQDAERSGVPRPSALFIDQPLARQFDLLKAALPERHRIGTILGPTSRLTSAELQATASARGMTLASAQIDEASALYGALQGVVADNDVLLLQPDPVAVNPDTVYGLFLASYRAQLPVVGFSEGLLNAGALLSLYSTALQQGRQAAEIARDALAHGGALPTPQYPKYFTVKVNASVARSLGLRVPNGDALAALLGSADASPQEPSAGKGTP